MSLMKKQTNSFKGEPQRAAGLVSTAYLICRLMLVQAYLSGLSSPLQIISCAHVALSTMSTKVLLVSGTWSLNCLYPSTSSENMRVTVSIWRRKVTMLQMTLRLCLLFITIMHSVGWCIMGSRIMRVPWDLPVAGLHCPDLALSTQLLRDRLLFFFLCCLILISFPRGVGKKATRLFATISRRGPFWAAGLI